PHHYSSLFLSRAPVPTERHPLPLHERSSDLRNVPVARSRVSANTCARALSVAPARCSKLEASAKNSPRESQRKWFSSTSCCTCLGAEPPAPVSNRPPPLMRGTMESIFALVPSSRIGNRSVL